LLVAVAFNLVAEEEEEEEEEKEVFQSLFSQAFSSSLSTSLCDFFCLLESPKTKEICEDPCLP
jgi:hypothetical protein